VAQIANDAIAKINDAATTTNDAVAATRDDAIKQITDLFIPTSRRCANMMLLMQLKVLGMLSLLTSTTLLT
jgi:hypothetical protein